MTAMRGRGDLRGSAVDEVCNDSRVARLQNPRPQGAGRAGALLIGAGLASLIAGMAIVRLVLWGGEVPAPADAAISDVFDAAAVSADRDFRRPIRVLAVAAATIPILAGLTLIAGARPLSTRLARLPRGAVLLGGALIGAALALAIGLVRLPFGALIHERLRDGGISRRGTAAWVGDALAGTGVQVVVFAIAIAVLARAIGWLPRAWPAALAAVLAAVGAVLVVAAPLVIQPLFEDTRPVDDPAVVAEIDALAAAAGVHVDEVVVNDAASRSRAFNARVEGLGATRRVVLYDTIIDEGDRDQLRWTVAHELAHQKHRHITKGLAAWIVMTVPLALLVAGVVAALTGPGAGRPEPALALQRTAIVAGTIVVLLALSAPFQNAASRSYEAEADWSALAITDEPLAALRARVASRARARADPDPPRLLHLWFGSHPTALERAGLALRRLEGS